MLSRDALVWLRFYCYDSVVGNGSEGLIEYSITIRFVEAEIIL